MSRKVAKMGVHLAGMFLPPRIVATVLKTRKLTRKTILSADVISSFSCRIDRRYPLLIYRLE